MAPSAVLSKFRNNRRGSNPSPTNHPSDPTASLPPQTSAVNTESKRPSSSTAIPGVPPASRSETSTDESSEPYITALPRFSDDLDRRRPSPGASEGPRLPTKASTAPGAPGPSNFAFSLQPPRKFTASLSPKDTSSPSFGSGLVNSSAERSQLGNASTSSLSVGEDASSNRAGSSRPGKGRFHLLNPLTLLARRRSSQHCLQRTEDASLNSNPSTVPALPPDYDPRIRGKIVHDFSVPKAQRLPHSSNGLSSSETSPSLDSRPSTQGTHRAADNFSPSSPWASHSTQALAHSPLFKEHFDDCQQRLPQSSGYLHSLATAAPIATNGEPPRLPAFAKSLPLDIFADMDEMPEEASPSSQKAMSIITADSEHSTPPDFEEIKPSSDDPPPTYKLAIPDMPTDKQTSPEADFLKPTESLPKHMTSTSSRFSFQLGGMGSEAQERLLEEKHKQHVASKLAAEGDKADSGSEGTSWTGADDDDGEGLEERIPGVNADSEEEATDHAQLHSLGSLHFTPHVAELSPSSLITASSQPTPRDSGGRVIGLADAKYSADLGLASPSIGTGPMVSEPATLISGLGIASGGSLVSRGWPAHVDQQQSHPFEDAEEDIDDLTSHQRNNHEIADAIIPLSAGQGMIYSDLNQVSRTSSLSDQEPEVGQQAATGQPSATKTSAEDQIPLALYDPTLPRALANIPGDKAVRPEISAQAETRCHGLTEDNLAYQNALVSAANEAVEQACSGSHPSESYDSRDFNAKCQVAESQPGLVSDDSRLSGLLDGPGQVGEFDQFPYDDTMEDDPMIAEANAEVLENDYEGFYGQEFGFFARAHGKGDSELVNGGYFGPRGIEGIHRSHSAKDKFQEPSLTPITERSEWSHRNSMGSVSALGLSQSAQAGSSPALARLYDSPILEDDMLSALMRLRREAWGGSQTSLSSTSGSQVGNFPFSHYPVRDCPEPPPAALENGQQSGSPSIWPSQDCVAIPSGMVEEDQTRRGLGPVVANDTTPKGPMDDRAQATAAGPGMPSPPLSHSSQASGKPGKSHKRTGSGAESVSYVRDPEGSERWLLERRRTGEDGELEVVEREYVAGARI